jgi:lipoic acid synthetase
MLSIRWLGRVAYDEAHDLQRALFGRSDRDHLLLLEHPHTYTLGVHGDASHVLVDPTTVGAELYRVDRGGDVTYHGPGQLVGYPILSVAGRRGGGMADTVAYVRSVEGLLIDALAELGVEAMRLDRYPGVWVDAPDGPAKIAAVGVRIARGRTMHGFALNVDPDLAMFDHIVPCGITDKSVTSLRAVGATASMTEVVDAVARQAASLWGGDGVDRADVTTAASRPSPEVLASLAPSASTPTGTSVRLRGRLASAGVTDGLEITQRKPDWLRAPLRLGAEVTRLGGTLRDLDLVTVCEEAGCPNLSECWAEGTATFMVCGSRCTRACGFCLVDTSKPLPLDPDEPARVAEAVRRMSLGHAVVTMVARDDLPDGGAAHMAATVEAIRAANPGTRVEVLISDLGGDRAALEIILETRPDVVNHNIETVARLQRAVRPSAGYARSLTVLARSARPGITVKSGLVVGMGETFDEVVQTLSDLVAVGVEIVTIGQYLRPTSRHLPVARWWEPADFDRWKEIGEDLGLAHVESSPLTRSSYHAARAAAVLQ